MAKGYIVTVEVFVPRERVKAMQRGTLNSKSEIASFEVEDVLEHTGLGYEIKNVRKVK